MRNVILGATAGIILGTVGAMAYSQMFGDGSLVDKLQSELADANADLAKLKAEKQKLTGESSGVAEQLDQLASANENLKKQLDDLKNSAPNAAPPTLNPTMIAGMVMGMMRGGGFQTQQRMLVLKARLHLTPDQETAIQAAMDADNKQRRQIAQQMFRGGKVDPQAAAAADTLDQTLATVLSPEQQAEYKQVQTEENAARADTTATIQINQMAPLLQLSDSQKDQVFNALYQVQATAPDPATLMTNPNVGAVLTAQAQAQQDAMAKVLTADQMALYQQEAAATPQFGFGGGRQRGQGGQGGGPGGQPGQPPQPDQSQQTPQAQPTQQTPQVQSSATTTNTP